ncbi:MAG: site-2 protease family protein [Anaerolineae bacterium]|nr:site-2 protease family protein [Anaerolineae bacterium]
MINEPSILVDGQSGVLVPPEKPTKPLRDPAVETIEAAVNAVMDVYKVEYDVAGPVRVRYTGRLRLDDEHDSETIYDQLDEQFAPLDYHVMLTTDDEGQHVIMALKGRINPQPRPIWVNVMLLVLTLFSLLFVGTGQATGGDNMSELWRGIPYALSIILILGSHELGHYFAARYHHVHVTLPYFIPMPLGFGTLGAFIQLREPMRNRKVLFDVGVAGPLAGLIFAVPILFIGLATSDVELLPEEGIVEGDSILYMASKYLVFGERLPNGNEDVMINQLALAGWTGLFITGLNLIPLGQLDGGHVMYTLIGRHAQRLYFPLLGLFVFLAYLNQAWLFWTFLLFMLGRVYAVPLDTVTELDPRRRWVGYAALVIFVLVFVPNPLRPV